MVLVFIATVDEIQKPTAEAIVAHLQMQIPGAYLSLQKIEPGSVKILVQGPRSIFKQVAASYEKGYLTEILGFKLTQVLWDPRSKLGQPKIVRPTIAIGLGGTGIEVIRNLKHEIRTSTLADSGIVDFLAMDTELAANYPGGKALSRSEYVYLGGFSASSILNNLELHPEIQEWWPVQEELPINAASSSFIHSGARQIRLIGRLSLFRNYRLFRNLLTSKLQEISSVEAREQLLQRGFVIPQKQMLAYIVCSLSGGTGSGSFMDVALSLRKRLKGDIAITGVFYLPTTHENEVKSHQQKRNMKANAFASLREIYQSQTARRLIRVRYPDETAEYVDQPFDRVFLVSNSTPVDSSFFANLSDLQRVTAEAIFLDLSVRPESIGQQDEIDQSNVGEFALLSQAGSTLSPLDYIATRFDLRTIRI